MCNIQKQTQTSNMNLSLLPDEILIMIGVMLSDRDLLVFATTARYYHDLIRSYFKEFIAVFPSSCQIHNPVLVIERSHPDFDKILRGVKKSEVIYARFMTHYNQSWFVRLYYVLKPKDEENINVHWHDNMEDEQNIDEGQTKYICQSRNDAVSFVIQNLRCTVFNILKNNNYDLYDPKNEDDYIQKTMEKLNDKNQVWLGIYNHNSFYLIDMVPLNTSQPFVVYQIGYIPEILGQEIDISTVNQMKLHNPTYKIHDNGGRPFIVIHMKNNTVCILKPKYEDDDVLNICGYIPVANYENVLRVLPGKDENPKYVGNSVLIHITGDEYVYVGDRIYSFTTNGDEIIEYYSLIGNNDVPYPVALSEHNAYFMLDVVCIARTEFPEDTDWMDAYLYFYGHFNNYRTTKFPNYTLIHSRV